MVLLSKFLYVVCRPNALSCISGLVFSKKENAEDVMKEENVITNHIKELQSAEVLTLEEYIEKLQKLYLDEKNKRR